MFSVSLKITLLAQAIFASFLFLFALSISAADAFLFLEGFALCAGVPVLLLLIGAMHLLAKRMDNKQTIVGVMATLMLLLCLLTGAGISLLFDHAFTLIMPFAAGAGVAGAAAALCLHQSLYRNLCAHYSSFEK